MKRSRIRLDGGVWAVGVLLLSMTVPSGQAAERVQKEDAPEPCHTTATSGSGSTFMKVCITKEGNVEYFESPAGAQHIYTDGYVLLTGSAPSTPCPSTNRWDIANQQSGWGAPTATGGGNTLPLTITRSTTDGKFKLVQKFTRNTAEREVIVEMKLTNTSSATQHAVRLMRAVAIDANGQFNEYWDRTVSTVAARWVNGVLLSAVSTPALARTAVVDGSAFQAANCTQPGLTVPVLADAVGVVQFDFGSMPKATTKTSLFKYQAY